MLINVVEIFFGKILNDFEFCVKYFDCYFRQYKRLQKYFDLVKLFVIDILERKYL